MVNDPRPERADAARNRRAIIRAAEELLQRYEPAEVSMERVAAAAGVGKATVFHRFGSRAELMQALAHDRTEALRAATLSGPPPLGPGAPPRERLMAFIDALIDHASRSIGLLTAQEHAALTSKTGAVNRDEHPVYRFWHTHVGGLIAAARPDLDADLLGHIMLGALHDPPIARLLRAGERDRVAASLRQLAASLLDSRDPRLP
ncbi:MAG TPA: TetR family transcriptional regulator [Streptosporangiaceae bacterium]